MRMRPADPDAEELLFAAYRKEIRFYEDQMMRQMGQLAESGGPR